MFLLPLSHEESVVRRLPWVSIGIFTACLVLEVHSCAVTDDLVAKVDEIGVEMAELEERAMEAYQETLSEEDQRVAQERFLEALASGRITEPFAEEAKKFRKGELTAPDDPRYARYKELEAEQRAVMERVPAIRFGYRPALDGLGSMLSAMFAHGGWLHLLGNMWFLYLVGCNLEDRWGRLQFLSFYVVAGCIAALTFTALHPESKIPLVGASGAVAGAMGAFMVCFARAKVKMFYFYWLFLKPRWGTFNASAWIVLAVWVLQEFAMTFVEISATSTQVAHSAHAGGFVFGGVIAALLKRLGVDSQLDEASERAADAEQTVWQEHPFYLQALDARAQGRDDEAAAMLVKLLGEQPDHHGACDVLLDLGILRGDARWVDFGLPRVFEEKQRARAYEALATLYRDLRKALPNYGLTDKELLGVATAAGHVKDGAMVIRAVGELLQQHPQSPLRPRAMWLAAEAQASLGVLDLQRDTLQRLLAKYPDHACGTLARQVLERKGAVV